MEDLLEGIERSDWEYLELRSPITGELEPEPMTVTAANLVLLGLPKTESVEREERERLDMLLPPPART